MKDLGKLMAKHRMTYRIVDEPAGDVPRTACSCGWVSNDPVRITDPALWEKHVEQEWNKPDG